MSNTLKELQLKADQTRTQAELLQKKLEEAQIANQKAQQILKEAIAATQAREEEVRNEINTKIQLTNLGIEFFLELINIIPQPILQLIISQPTSIVKEDIFLLSSLNDLQELALPNSKYTDQLVDEFNKRITSVGYEFDNSQSNYYILRELRELRELKEIKSIIEPNSTLELESIDKSEIIQLEFTVNNIHYNYGFTFKEIEDLVFFSPIKDEVKIRYVKILLKNLGQYISREELLKKSLIDKSQKRNIYLDRSPSLQLGIIHKYKQIQGKTHHKLELTETIYRAFAKKIEDRRQKF